MEDLEELRRLAARQHGVVGAWQVPRRLRPERRVASGEWERLTPTVLRAVSAPATDRQQLMAAVLDAGLGAAASFGSAAVLWNLPGFSLARPEVTRGGRRSSRRPPIAVLHRPVLLLPQHLTEVAGIPVTTLARTIFDLAAAGLAAGRLAALVNLVANRSPGTLVALHRTLEELARRGRPGIRVMRVVLADRPPGSRLPTGLEAKFESILRNGGEAPFERQVDLGGHEWLGRVDYWDRTLRLLVEVDSIVHHTSPMDRARDAARDTAMLDAGVRRVLRIPEEHIWREPWLVLDAVRTARRELHHAAPEPFPVQLRPRSGRQRTENEKGPVPQLVVPGRSR